MLIAIQLESVAAIENAAAIAALDGADIVLSASTTWRVIWACWGRRTPRCASHGPARRAGNFESGQGAGHCSQWRRLCQRPAERGYRFIVGPHNIAMLRDAGISAFQITASLKLSRELGETPTVSLQANPTEICPSAFTQVHAQHRRALFPSRAVIALERG